MINPATSELHALPGADDITRLETANGITVLVRCNPFSPSVVISGYLPAGSQFDPPDKLGLAHLTSLGLMRGSARRTFQQIFDDLETAGASLGFSASVHNVSFGGRSLVEDLPLLLDLLSQALIQPTFPEDQINRLRAQHLTSLAIRAQDTSEMASLVFDETLFAGHPYALPEEGYAHTIQNISRDDLQCFHRQVYTPRGMVIAVVGAVSPPEIIAQILQRLADWQPKVETAYRVFPTVQPPPEPIRRHITIGGKTQTDLVLGTLGPRRGDPDFFAAALGNNILGQLGMMGRIGEIVREQNGLAYYAAANLVASYAAGSWEVSAGVDPSNLEAVINLVQAEIRRFTREPVSREEMEDSKANLVGRLPLALQSNAGVAGALINIERFQLGLDYYRRYPALIQRVTREEVFNTARRFLGQEKMVIISAGPDGD